MSDDEDEKLRRVPECAQLVAHVRLRRDGVEEGRC